MNKKNWITIILDDTINDEKIMDYINKSYLLVEKK
jgi:predicted DNA-binding protein (MmcQ/YjbR family)